LFSLFVSAEDESLIPSWLKISAKFWIEDQTTDREFLDSLQYLFDQGILKLPTEIESTDVKTIETLQKLEGFEAVTKITSIKKLSSEFSDKEITLRLIKEPKESVYYLAIHPYAIEWNGTINTVNQTDIKKILIEGKAPALIQFECWVAWGATVYTKLYMFEPGVESPSLLVEVFKNDVRLDGGRAGYNISWVTVSGKC